MTEITPPRERCPRCQTQIAMGALPLMRTARMLANPHSSCPPRFGRVVVSTLVQAQVREMSHLVMLGCSRVASTCTSSWNSCFAPLVCRASGSVILRNKGFHTPGHFHVFAISSNFAQSSTVHSSFHSSSFCLSHHPSDNGLYRICEELRLPSASLQQSFCSHLQSETLEPRQICPHAAAATHSLTARVTPKAPYHLVQIRGGALADQFNNHNRLTSTCDIVKIKVAHTHRLTASVTPEAVTTLYTSAEEPLPMTSSRTMSLPRQLTAHTHCLLRSVTCSPAFRC